MVNLGEASNCEDWRLECEIIDDGTGEPVDLTGASIVFDVRRSREYDCLLSASTENGLITLGPDVGEFVIAIPVDQMQQLRRGTHDVGCTVTLLNKISQLFVGTIPVIDGVVR